MGFSIGSLAKIKEVVSVYEKYTVCKLTITKKNKETKKTDLQFSGFVRFIGKAHNNKPRLDQMIKITNFEFYPLSRLEKYDNINSSSNIIMVIFVNFAFAL